MAKAKITGKSTVEIDLTGVSAGDKRRKTQIPEGEYLAKVVSASAKKFNSGSKGVEWVVEVTSEGKGRGARFWYNNVLINAEGEVAENSLWSFRGFLQALEPKVKIPDRMVKIPLGKMVNREVGIEVADGEYEGKVRSEIIDVFHPDQLDEEEGIEEDEEDEFEDEEEEDEDEDEFDLDEDEL